MKNLLITGAAGFIGSNALDYFIDSGRYRNISVVDKITYAADPRRITKHQDVSFYRFDIVDLRWVYVLEKEKPDVVINFAASSHVDKSILVEESDDFIYSNYMGVAKIVNGIRQYQDLYNKTVLFLHISTDEVLGDTDVTSTEEFKEDAPLKPNNPYAATKAGAEQLIGAMHHTYKDFDYMIVRATNNYGPNQHFEKLLPTVIRSILMDKKIPVYGEGKNVREWLWTGDFVRGLDLLIDTYYKRHPGYLRNKIYHFGSNIRRHNIDVVKLILKLMGKSEELIEFVTDRPGHDRRYALDCTKVKELLDWEPTQDFEDGLKIVINDIKNRTEEA